MTHIRSGIPPAHQGPVSHPRPARTSSPFLLRLIPPRTASPVTFPSLPLPETRQLLQAPSEVKRQSVFSTQHVPIYDHEFIFPSRSTPRPIACARCQFQLDACARHMFSHGRSPLVFTKHAPTCCDDTHVRGAPEMYPVPPPSPVSTPVQGYHRMRPPTDRGGRYALHSSWPLIGLSVSCSFRNVGPFVRDGLTFIRHSASLRSRATAIRLSRRPLCTIQPRIRAYQLAVASFRGSRAQNMYRNV